MLENRVGKFSFHSCWDCAPCLKVEVIYSICFHVMQDPQTAIHASSSSPLQCLAVRRMKHPQLCEGMKSVLEPQILQRAVKIWIVVTGWRMALDLNFR